MRERSGSWVMHIHTVWSTWWALITICSFLNLWKASHLYHVYSLWSVALSDSAQINICRSYTNISRGNPRETVSSKGFSEGPQSTLQLLHCHILKKTCILIHVFIGRPAPPQSGLCAQACWLTVNYADNTKWLMVCAQGDHLPITVSSANPPPLKKTDDFGKEGGVVKFVKNTWSTLVTCFNPPPQKTTDFPEKGGGGGVKIVKNTWPTLVTFFTPPLKVSKSYYIYGIYQKKKLL